MIQHRTDAYQGSPGTAESALADDALIGHRVLVYLEAWSDGEAATIVETTPGSDVIVRLDDDGCLYRGNQWEDL